MTQSLDAVILSVPYNEALPMVAPVLLSACLNQGGVSAKGIDLNLVFYEYFSKKNYFTELKNQLVIGYIQKQKFPIRAVIDILKFNKKFLLDIKKKYNPKWIGLSIFSQQSIDFSYILIYSIRKYLPGVKIVIGGKGSELVCSIRKKRHSEIYIEHGLAELAVVGDCEHTIADMLKKNQTGVVINPQQSKEDLDNIPLPNWDEYDLKKYIELSNYMEQEPYMAISASKGCIRTCTFCDVGNFWPKYIYRDPYKVANEMITAYKKTGIRTFVFTDNLINGSVSNYRKINETLVKELPPGTLSYGGYAIFRDRKYMEADDFSLAKQAGCRWWAIGVESGSERLRFDQGKKITDEDLDWSVKHLAKNNIEQRWLMMVGYPSETDEDFKLTIELFKKYAYLGRQGHIKISITPTFMLLKNSPLMENKKIQEELGLAHNLQNPWADKFWTSTKNIENTFPVRLYRWKTLVKTMFDLGYPWNPAGDLDGWHKELDELEKVYNELSAADPKFDFKFDVAYNESKTKNKFIPISQI